MLHAAYQLTSRRLAGVLLDVAQPLLRAVRYASVISSYALELRMTGTNPLYARTRSSRLLLLLALAVPGCTLVLSDLPPRVQDGGEPDVVEQPDDDAGTLDATAHDDAASDAALDVDVPALDDASERDALVADAAEESCDGGVAWYADEDGDGFGVGEAVVACPKPSGKWAREAGDCQDEDKRVFPRQALYFGAPYRARDGNDSYDYDCSGLEDGNPKQPNLGGGCGLLELTACQGSGYARTQRTGLLLNPVCGSTVIDTCEYKALILLCGSTSQTTTDPYLCH